MPRDRPPTPPPKPTPLILPQRNSRGNNTRPRADSSPRSPRHKSYGAEDADTRAFNTHAEVCHCGRYDGEPNSRGHGCSRPHGYRAHTTQNISARQSRPPRAQSSYKRQYQSLPTQRLNRGLSRGSRSKTAPNSEQPRPSFDPDHIGVCCRSSRGIPSQANAPPNVPRRTSSIPESFSTPENEGEGDTGVSDRDVLRGLHIAASAACDEEVDTFVRNKTGLRLRRFLADLMVLETLRDVHPDEGRGLGARRRRSTLRQLKQQIRRSREIGELGIAA